MLLLVAAIATAGGFPALAVNLGHMFAVPADCFPALAARLTRFVA